MEILAAITNLIVVVMDIPLGWLLALPRDVAIVLVALGTSLLLTLVRKWTTNQDQLCRSKGDLVRLKQLLRERKRAKDKAAAGAIRTSLGMVNAIRLKAEVKPLLVSLLPIILLAVWAVERLDFFPPRVGDDLTVKAYYPLSSVDALTHLVPPVGVEMKSPAVQLVEVDPHGQQNGLATWVLHPTSRLSAELLIRHQGETASHAIRVGGRSYAPPLGAGSGNRILATETVLRQAKFLGIVPGLPAIALPPWLIAYLLIVIPFVPILRRVLRVY
jgi:uncharacterized membrane protein (DUF106 family)